MTFQDTIALSWRNLRQAKLRTGLTILGVSIGIASLAGMISLGVGLQDQMVGRFVQSGIFGTITVTTQADLPGPLAQMGNRGRFGGRGARGGGQIVSDGTPEKPIPELDDETLKQLSALENVREVYPNLRVPVEVTVEQFSRGVNAVGVTMSSKDEGTFQLAYGRFFSGDSERACLIGLDMAKQIAGENPSGLIGKSIKLSYPASRANDSATDPGMGFRIQRVDTECQIVGILERNPGPLGLGGGSILSVSSMAIPMDMARAIGAEIITNAQSMLRNPSQRKSYSSITVKVKQAQHTQDVEDRIRSLGYTAFSLDDALRGAKNAFILLDIFLSLIGSIALAVSSLGIVNTMVMSILERTREIGIMKAIGASDYDIRRIFLIEASVIGLFGGLAGIALGWSVGRVINFGANIYIRSQGGTAGNLFSLPIWLTTTAIAFSIVVSLAAGSYPASRAAHLDPIRALRHD